MTFFGVCERPHPCLVMEFCDRGCLYNFLNLNRDQAPLDWSYFLSYSHQIAKGLQVDSILGIIGKCLIFFFFLFCFFFHKGASWMASSNCPPRYEITSSHFFFIFFLKSFLLLGSFSLIENSEYFGDTKFPIENCRFWNSAFFSPRARERRPTHWQRRRIV